MKVDTLTMSEMNNIHGGETVIYTIYNKDGSVTIIKVEV